MSEKFPPPGFVLTPSALEGIEVYKPAPIQPEAPAIEVFKCPQCGAPVSFDISKNGLTCPHCGYIASTEINPVGKVAEEHEFHEEIVRSSALGWGIERKDLSCQQCGAVVSIPIETLASTCPFCGSHRVINRVSAQDQIRPFHLIPYKIKPEDCKEITRKWLGNHWMTPTELSTAASLASFTPIFIPYWTFDTTCNAKWQAEVGREETEFYTENGQQKSRIVIRWRWQSGKVKKEFDDLLVPATSRQSSKIIQKIGKFRLADLVPYQSLFLAGIQAQTYDVNLDSAWEIAREKMREDTRQSCKSQAGSPHIRNFSMELDFSDESWRLILVPIYISVYRYNNSQYQILINGQTGDIAGPRPADWTKVWIAIAVALAPGVLLGLIGLITSFFGIGFAIGGIAFVLLLIGLVVGAILFKHAQELDDV